MGTLYVVGTPIGNLSDMTFRAVKTLQEVDFIAAEDTRVTGKLLSHFEIKKPMVSYHEHNLRERGEYIASRLQAGESCAIVTDAGMPCISDPGEDLVIICAELGISIEVVPGPSAVISAICVSGQRTSRFTFEGFLSTAKTSRIQHLVSLKNEPRTMVFYEAPHKLKRTLKDMLEYLGDRKISLARELTKIYEEVQRTTISGAIEHYVGVDPRGEYVLVIEGKPQEVVVQLTLDQAIDRALELELGGEKTTDAAKLASRECGFSKSQIYNGMVAKKA